MALVIRRTPGRRAQRKGIVALDVQLGAGLRALVGTPQDGLLALAPLLAGTGAADGGEARVFGRDPQRDPGVRVRIGTTLHDPSLPGARTVGALLRDIDAIRGGDAATRALARFGLDAWRQRKPSDLVRAERRALSLIIALSTPSPLALLLTEPTVDIARLDRDQVQQALAAAARGGACVVVASASIADAVSLAPVVHLLERGSVSDARSVDQMGTSAWPHAHSLRVEVDLPRLLLAALSDDPAVSGVTWDQDSERSMLTLQGRDLEQLALAVAAAASSSGAAISSIVPVPADLEQMRARTSGAALAAYYSAYYRHWAEQRPAAAPAPSPGPAETQP
jgi:ABC-type multidrug transport system ATPase subunit